MTVRRVDSLNCQVGVDTIRCRVHRPVQGNEFINAPGILIIPGFADTAVGPHNLHVQMADRLVHAGYVVARFDYRGLGESDGDFKKFTLGRGLEDASSVLELLVQQEGVDSQKIGIVGYSLGGTLATAVAAANSTVRAVALLAPVAHPNLVFHTFFQPHHWNQLERYGWMDWLGWAVGRDFIQSLNEIDPLAAMERINAAVLAIHGTNDKEVQIENAYFFASKGAEFQELSGADHLFSAVRYKEELFVKVSGWLQEHLNEKRLDR